MEKKRSEFGKSFAIWFGIAAVMYGTQVGGSMAAGTYAVGYFATFGGGWLLVFCGIYFLFRAGFSVHALEFIRIYKTTDWNSFYLELYGLNRPNANKVLRLIVTTFFDVMSVFSGIIITAATINLFGALMDSIFGVPVMIGRLIAVVLYALLTMYGAGFLRKFNGVMTVGLLNRSGLERHHPGHPLRAGDLLRLQQFQYRHQPVQLFSEHTQSQRLYLFQYFDRPAVHLRFLHDLLHRAPLPAGDDRGHPHSGHLRQVSSQFHHRILLDPGGAVCTLHRSLLHLRLCPAVDETVEE